MEFMKITDRSLKISLGAKEAEEYNVTEEMVGSPPEIKRAFSELLEMAKRELGMILPKGQLLAEVFSSRDGGYEIFVSYTAENEIKNVTESGEYVNSGKKDLKEKIGAKISGVNQSGVFLVNSPNELIYLVSLLKNDNKYEYEVYFSPRAQKYYLIVDGFKRREMLFAPFYEVAQLLGRAEIKYIQAYCEKIST